MYVEFEISLRSWWFCWCTVAKFVSGEREEWEKKVKRSIQPGRLKFQKQRAWEWML